jgi:hypothetical protein
MDNDGVTRSALESSERGDQDFGAPDLEGIEHVMDDEGGHSSADFNIADFNINEWGDSAASSRVKQAARNNLLGKRAKEGLAGMLGEPDGVAVRVGFNAAPVLLGFQRHIPAGNADHEEAESRVGGKLEEAVEVGDADIRPKGSPESG